MTNHVLRLHPQISQLAPDHSLPISGFRDSHAPKYRLAFAIHRYFDYGGLQRSMRRVAQACADLGHEVHIFTSEWQGSRPENIFIHVLPLKARTNHGRCHEFSQRVQEAVDAGEFDCLVGYSKMPGLDVYRCGDPCLADRMRRTRAAFLRWLPRYRTYLQLEEGIFGGSSDAELLVIAEPEKESFIRHYADAAPRLQVLPPGIDRKRLEAADSASGDRDSLRHRFEIPPSASMALMVGSSFNTKGVDRAIHAVAGLPENEREQLHLVIVGDGRAEPMQRLANRRNLADRVHFAGACDDVASFYRGADFLLHPARLETGGATILEAMYSGLPVLVTANCGYSTHVERAGAGLVCPEPFAQSTLNRLLRKMLSPESRRTWGQNAREYCRKNDLYSMVESTVEVILSRAAKNRRAA